MSFIPLMFFATSAFAASSEGGIPKVVYYQALNVFILGAILFYFLKDKVRNYFKIRKENYLQAAREVENLRKQVESQAALLREKIRHLDDTAEASQQQALRDSQEYSQRLLGEAREQAEKLKIETEKTIRAEVFKAIDSLRSEVVDQSISNSREMIQTQIKDSDQKRLQSEFVEKIGVVEK